MRARRGIRPGNTGRSPRLELRAQLSRRFHRAAGSLRFAPVLMDCAGNSAAMLRAHSFAVVLGVAANVEDLHIVAPDSFEQMRIRGESFRARLQLEIRRREFLDFGRQLFAGRF